MKKALGMSLVHGACSVGFCFLPAFLSVVNGFALQNPAGSENSSYTIILNVDQVVLDVSVLDPEGGFISELGKECFQVYEDSRPQNIEFFRRGDVPVTIGLVVDNSGSMRPKRPQVVAAALAFIQSCNPQDELFVIKFNEKVVFGLSPHELFSNSVTHLRDALIGNPPAGQTALYDAIAMGLGHLQKGRHDKKALLVVSDGGDNASQLKFRDLLTMAQQSNAILYTVALFDEQDSDRNPKVLKRLSKVSGGEFFSPPSISEVSDVCRQIARDIRNQYTLVYNPTNNARDGKYRTIQVTVNSPRHKKCVVRARKGYFAPVASASNQTDTMDRTRGNNPLSTSRISPEINREPTTEGKTRERPQN
jgi:Ca-activated chloride channel homolog